MLLGPTLADPMEKLRVHSYVLLVRVCVCVCVCVCVYICGTDGGMCRSSSLAVQDMHSAVRMGSMCARACMRSRVRVCAWVGRVRLAERGRCQQ